LPWENTLTLQARHSMRINLLTNAISGPRDVTDM